MYITSHHSLFNMTNIICQVAWQANTSRDTLSSGPDRSAARARHDSALFLPGVSSSLLAFIIFGTTTPFRNYMREVFVERIWRGFFLRRPLPPATTAITTRQKSLSLSSSAYYSPQPDGGSGGGGGDGGVGGGGGRVNSGYYEVTVYGPQGRRTTSISYAPTAFHPGAMRSDEEEMAGDMLTMQPMKSPARTSVFHREPEPVYDGRHHHHQHHRSGSTGWS